MNYLLAHKWQTTIVIVIILTTLLLISQILYIRFTGDPVAVPSIPRDTQVFGTGPKRNFVVMGDSTSIGQGADYARSIAYLSAVSLAHHHELSWTNLGVSGAVTQEVVEQQLPRALELKPDVVLLALGANDVTHLTSLKQFGRDMQSIIMQLQTVSPNIKIFLTGSPDMSSVPRFASPTQWIAGIRTKQVNKVVQTFTKKTNVTFIPIAEKTGAIFKARPELFAADKFHPTADGYAVWMPLILESFKQQGL